MDGQMQNPTSWETGPSMDSEVGCSAEQAGAPVKNEGFWGPTPTASWLQDAGYKLQNADYKPAGYKDA